MIKRYPYRDLVWVDAQSPTAEEIRGLMEEFDLPELVAEDLLSSTLRPRVDLHKNCIYLVLHFPAIRHSWSVSKNQEIDFVIGKHFLITTRYDTIDPVHSFSKTFEVHSILERGNLGNHAGYIFFHMIKKLYQSLHHELEYLNDELQRTEERIFEGYEKEMVVEISRISRELINFRNAIRNHDEVLASFEEAGVRFFGESFRFHMRSITGEFSRVSHAAESCHGMLAELRETNDSLITTKQNEIMKTLTIMAFTTFPLTLVAALFSMDTKFTPIVGLEHDFWIVTGGMVIGVFIMFGFFKWKKWL